MGIKSLHKWLTWVCSPPPLVCWSQWNGMKLGIDVLGFIYKAKYDNLSPVEEIAKLIHTLKSHEIQPIFVFDGKSPAEKASTRSARQRQRDRLSESAKTINCIQSFERNDIKQLLYASGCLYLNATEEADSVLAYMMRQGWISGILSMDMDFLPRGCENLLVPYKSSWQHYRLASILQESKLSFSQFFELCLLLGSDYNPNIPTLSYQKIYWSILHSNLNMQMILAKEGIRDMSLWDRAKRNIMGKGDTWDILLSEVQQNKWIKGAPSSEPEFFLSHLTSWSESNIQVLKKNINYIDGYAISADAICTDLSVEETVVEPFTTNQNVPIVSINNIKNSMAESSI